MIKSEKQAKFYMFYTCSQAGLYEHNRCGEWSLFEMSIWLYLDCPYFMGDFF